MTADRLRLSVESLYTYCDPSALASDSTDDMDDIDPIEVQPRAAQALEFGITIAGSGFNIFALGPPGAGKFTTVSMAVEAASRAEPVPSDWCYVNNFVDPKSPIAIELPPGKGNSLKADMRHLVEELSITIPAVFDNDDTHSRLEQIEEEFRQRRNAALEALREEGAAQGIAVMETPAGFTFAPMHTPNTVMTPEQYQQLSSDDKAKVQRSVEALQDKLQKLLRQFQVWGKEARENVKALHREIAELAVGELVNDLLDKYKQYPQVTAYLQAAQANIVDHVDDFMPRQQLPFQFPTAGQEPGERYAVNVIVDNSETQGAPVVHEPLPSFGNVIGRCEHTATMGTLVTNFTLIKPGALHRANGGYLLLDARQLLQQPYAWETLKRALRAQCITIESLERSLSLASTVALEPQPIPLKIKVILVGERMLYYLLRFYDPDFAELFKVAADFDIDMDRDDGNLATYSRLVATLCRRHVKRPADGGAIARIVEHAARVAGHADKLSTHLSDIADLLVEAEHCASKREAAHIARQDVDSALSAREARLDRLRDRLLENIRRGSLLIDTGGEAIAQVNGLAVTELGGFAFGHPVRITATTRLGEGKIIDIEKEIEMGGPIHSKGVMILSSFLMSRYARLHPISVSASLVFEQSYAGVDGDSASLAELSALLSSLARIPIKQNLAITGSVNQHGRAQPIGGVNEKIEGFFDVCRDRGLDGSHGVIIPQSNVDDLMLRADVVEAARCGEFSIYAVSSADEAIELLTGLPAGEANGAGEFPDGSVNAKVDAALVQLAKLRSEHAKAHLGANQESNANATS